MKRLFLHLSILTMFFAATSIGRTQTNEVTLLDSELVSLEKACEILAEDPADKKALDQIRAYVKNTNGVDRLRSRAMAAYALSSLMKGSTNLYVRARLSHARSYPDDQHLLRIDPKDCYIACSTCNGKGFVTTQCTLCEGDNRCKACKGTGLRLKQKNLKGTRNNTKELKCSVCKGTGKTLCRRCKGTGRVAVRCPDCKGKPYTFKTPTKVVDDFALLVKGIAKWIGKEEVFLQQFNAAKNKKEPEKRISALRSLIADYGYREEKAEMKQMLEEEQAAIKKEDKTKTQEAVKAERDLMVLRDLKESGNPGAAVKIIRDYLEENPETEHRLELQGMINDMAAKIRKRDRNRKYLYILGGVLLLLFGLSMFKFRK